MFAKPTTVDSVLSVFTTAIADLNKVAAAQEAVAAKQSQVIVDAQAAQAAAVAEATRATTIAAQIQAVFG